MERVPLNDVEASKIKRLLRDLTENEDVKDETIDGIWGCMKKGISAGLEDARLAHYKHAIEFLEKKANGSRPHILYHNYKREKFPSGNMARIQYFNSGYMITIPEDISSDEKRSLVSHELGHILASILFNKYGIKSSEKTKELLACAFAFQMTMTQGEFYEKTAQKYIYNTPERRQVMFDELRRLAKSYAKQKRG